MNFAFVEFDAPVFKISVVVISCRVVDPHTGGRGGHLVIVKLSLATRAEDLQVSTVILQNTLVDLTSNERWLRAPQLLCHELRLSLDWMKIVLLGVEHFLNHENASFQISQVSLLRLHVRNALRVNRICHVAPVMDHLARHYVNVQKLEVIIGGVSIEMQLFIKLVPIDAVEPTFLVSNDLV